MCMQGNIPASVALIRYICVTTFQTMLPRLILVLSAITGIFSSSVSAQEIPIGFWRNLSSYKTAIGVATNGNELFAITDKAFYTYNPLSVEINAYSKVQGMSDMGMQCIGYDMATGTTVLAYNNGNVDLFKNNTFYKVPDLKIKTIAGEKTINAVYVDAGFAYLSTSIGVVVVDITKQNIKETYEFNRDNRILSVKGIWTRGDSLYTITSFGMYSADRNSRLLQNFQIWKTLDTVKEYKHIAGYGTELFVATDKLLYRVVNGVKSLVYTSRMGIEHLDPGEGHLLISEYDTATFSGMVHFYSPDKGMYDSIVTPGIKPRQTVETLDGKVCIADEFGGLLQELNNRQLGYFTPIGPINSNSFDIYANNGELWVAHGGFNDRYNVPYNGAGISKYKDGAWKYYSRGIYPPFNELTDFCVFLKDEKTNTVYAGSFIGGLYVMKPDETGKIYTAPNPFDPSIAYGPTNAQIAGLGLDSYGNLWVSTMYSPVHQLYVKTPEDAWMKFSVPNAQYGGPIVMDDFDRIWFGGYADGGLNVYYPNGTPLDKSDDFSYHLSTGKGNGNLPSNTVYCVAKDKNNNIWVGTANGIGIISNCLLPQSSSQPCDAELPIVQYDQFAGYLFAGNSVRSIAVDGANRKWVGTDDGVWLLSPDASKIIYRFTMTNSPLPSNKIQKISIDGITGEVYIGTDMGLVSFRSTATEGGTKNEQIVSFPNPVPSGYTGTIAIKGLVSNADVRITDINGQLVYRTRALGGQAVWNGLDYTGRRPQSGVYFIFASDNSGTETYTGKLVFIN